VCSIILKGYYLLGTVIISLDLGYYIFYIQDTPRRGALLRNYAVKSKECTGKVAMKIKVERDKIIQAVKKLEGIELVLDNSDDAREALDLILGRTDLFASGHFRKLKDLKVTAVQEYKTSAVDYTIQFVLEFLFEDDVTADMKAAFIKDLQAYFNKL
jgi:hypothetical protein